MPPSITIAVLLYGDYPELAERCLKSIATHAFQYCPANIRIGMNECSPVTKQYVRSLVAENLVLDENIYESDVNMKKYPMMRHMFYDEDNPIDTDYVMWFDDDSYIKGYEFGARVTEMLSSDPPDMIGSQYTIPINNNQINWIRDQSWFTGKPISKKMPFATGGWWVARMEMLRAVNYPYPELIHRGGDVMLGAMIQQQGFRLKHYKSDVAINADADGRESKAKRRGFDEPSLGQNYKPEAKIKAAETPPAKASTVPPTTKETKTSFIDLGL